MPSMRASVEERMAFTTWAALRTAMKDALADHYATGKFVGTYTIGARTVQYKNEEQFMKRLLENKKI